MIESSRFYLRKFIKEDAVMMFNNWANDLEVTKHLSWNPHGNIKVTENYLEFVINTKQTNFAIVDKKTKEVIGSISNVRENVDFTICEVGYCLSKKYWNQGVMTEVFQAYLKYLFEQKNYQIVEASHKHDNPASGRVMIKSGLRLNYINDQLSDKFGWITMHHYSITKEEYMMRKLQKEISDFFKFPLPVFSNVSGLMNYLDSHGFLVSAISTIESSKVVIPRSDVVYTTVNKDYNIVTHYFVSKQSDKKSFIAINDRFILSNKDYIISTNNKKIEQLLVNMLRKHHLTISFAESCTGGLMASTIVNVSGASDVLKESYVTYSEEAKIRILGVKKQTLNDYTVYSRQTALEMAKGLKLVSNANICVSITGLAGGNIPSANDGSYHSAIIINCNNIEKIVEFRKSEKGLRNSVRTKQVNYVFYRIIKALEEIF